MAVTTITSSIATAGAQARAPHVGMISRSARLVTQVLGTDGDTYLLAKIPNGATITAVYGTSASQEALAIFSVGITGEQGEAGTAVFGTFTNSGSETTNWSTLADDDVGGALPYTVSMSDSRVPLYVFLMLRSLTGSWSTSVSLAWTVQYSMDGQ